MSVIFVEHRENGELADALNVYLSDQDGAFGIKRLHDGQVVIAANTPVLHVSLGRYEFDIDMLSGLFDYIYVFRIITQDDEGNEFTEFVQGFIPSTESLPPASPPDQVTDNVHDEGTFVNGYGFDGVRDLPATGGERTQRDAYGYGDGFWDGISYEDLCVYPITPKGQCVIGDTKVETPFGTTEIRNVKEGDWLKIIDRKTGQTQFQIVQQTHINNTKEGCLTKIVTKHGRELLCTPKHPLINWEKENIQARYLKKGMKIVCDPLAVSISEAEDTGIILTEQQFDVNMAQYQLLRLQYMKDRLKEEDLLPLRANDYRALIVSRLLGHVFGDGYLYAGNSKFPCSLRLCGKPSELQAIKDDLDHLDIHSSRIATVESKSSYCDSQGVSHKIEGESSTFTVRSNYIVSLLIALGAPVGDKTVNPVLLPEWLFEHKSCLREFLATYYDAEGFSPLTKNDTINYLAIGFSKAAALDENAQQYSQQLVKAFHVFGIQLRLLEQSQRGALRKDGHHTQQYILMRDGDSKSRTLSAQTWIVFAENIGLRYNVVKKKQLGYVAEYARAVMFEVAKKQKAYREAKRLLGEGLSRSTIARRCKVSRDTIDRWLRVNANIDEKHFRPPQDMNFRSWYKNYVNQDLVFDEVLSIERVLSNEDVYDVTMDTLFDFTTNGLISFDCYKDKAAAMARAMLKDTDPSCWAFSEDEIDMYLEGGLSDFNATPMFTRFQWHDLEDRWLHIIALGAQVFALFAQGLIEVGREFVITDNGISFQPPPISSHFQSTATTLLAHYQQNKELIKGNMKPTPSMVGVFTVLAINPMLMRLRHLRERRII